MLNAKAPLHTEFKFAGLPISSAYLVILRRYLGILKNEHAQQDHAQFSAQADDYLESTVALERITPLLEELENLVGHQAFCIEIGRHMHPSDYGIFGYAMMNCASVGSALHTAARLKSIRNQNLTASFFKDKDHFVYQLTTSGQDTSLDMLVELDISTAFQFGKILVGPHRKSLIQLDSVNFTHAPLGPIELYEKRFNCPVYFNQAENLVRMSEQMAELPIYAANPKILSVLENKILKIISGYAHENESLSAQVVIFLNQKACHDFPDITETANFFNMSLSTFKKKLKEEQTCFQDLCNAVKRDRSFKLLKSKEIAIKTIAFDLGFANPSAFNRAFKRWTGQSPASYRKALD